MWVHLRFPLTSVILCSSDLIHLVPHYIYHRLGVGYHNMLLGCKYCILSSQTSYSRLFGEVFIIEITLVKLVVNEEAIIDGSQYCFLSLLFLCKLIETILKIKEIVKSLGELRTVDAVRMILKRQV